MIDMWPAIESALRLSAPIMPLCNENCLGICPVCGVNKNNQECTCAEKEDFSDSPFAVLNDFKFES